MLFVLERFAETICALMLLMPIAVFVAVCRGEYTPEQRVFAIIATILLAMTQVICMIPAVQ